MKIQILQKGGTKNHETIERATRWAIGKLFSTRLANTLHIRIEIRASLNTGSVDGRCFTPSNGSKATRKFRIQILRDAPLRSQIRILFHELAHVHQFATGRLQARIWKTDRKLHYRWQGEHVGTAAENPYSDRGWEVEARKVERDFAAEWDLSEGHLAKDNALRVVCPDALFSYMQRNPTKSMASASLELLETL